MVCAGGVSTSILTETMKTYCSEKDIIKAISYSNLNQLIDQADIVFVAPQIVGLFEQIKHLCDQHNVLCQLIDTDSFGHMDGETIMNLASEIMDNRKIKGDTQVMKHLKITLACAGGVSTSILCSRIISACAEKGYEAECKAYGANSLRNEQVAGSDVILLGPQVCYMEDDIIERFPDIPVRLIEMMDYGTMNAKNIVNRLLEEFNW